MIHTANWSGNDRLGGLLRFAAAITFFNILGHTVLGFEQSWLQPLMSLATGYTVALLLESVFAWSEGQKPCFLRGGVKEFIIFLLPSHISCLAVAMLLYSNETILPVMLGSAIAVGSKYIFRVYVGTRSIHFLNPSNFGITIVLLLFPWVGIAPPYHFTEELSSIGDWFLPMLIVCTGSFLNTKRIPLILAWLGGFALQAILRSQIQGTPLLAPLSPMTGVAFVLFTFYMVTDPPTTPSSLKGQIIFGFAVAACYGLLMVRHIVFGFFFALTMVTAARGILLFVRSLNPAKSSAPMASSRQKEKFQPLPQKLEPGLVLNQRVL
jgi:enediyne biosynthesis protein E5